jgi:hypothetical protein
MRSNVSSRKSMATTGYDIDALLATEGTAYQKIHPVYLALSNAFDREDLRPEELPFHDAQFFRDYLNMSGFSRFCEPEYVAEFTAALDAFQTMQIGCLEQFCTDTRTVLKENGLIDDHGNPNGDLDMDYERSEQIGEKLSDEFHAFIGSSEIDDELFRYLSGISPTLRDRATADYLWTWAPDVAQGYGGKSETIPNPTKS